MSVTDPVAAPVEPVGHPGRRRRLPGRVLRHLLLARAAILALYPVWFMVTTAFKERDQYLDDILGFPWPLTIGNFDEALRGGEFFTWMKNSAIFAGGAVI